MARLLMVDDEENIRRLFADEMEDEGHQVTTAPDAAAGVALLEEQAFDLLVLDIKMDGESGLDMLQRVVRQQSDLPVVLFSAFGCFKDDISSWLADAYVVKSADFTELKHQINQLLAKRGVNTRGGTAR